MVNSSQKSKCDTAQLLDVIHHPHDKEQTLEVLTTFISNKSYVGVARKLDEGDVVKLVDVIDQAIGTDDWDKSRKSSLLRALGSICGATAILPHTTILSDGLTRSGEIAVASGGFTDTWRGQLKTIPVSLKAFRTYPSQDLKEVKKILWKEVVTWKRLSHKNVLRFYGVDRTIFQLALVYDWARSGNITQYLGSHPNASRTRLLREVAEGLCYLHSYGVVHGDLKGTNVLISPLGEACLSDYGLMPIQSNHAFMEAATPGVVGISRWLAPELIDPPRKKGYRQPAATEQADIFAFAMLVIEIFTGELPFGKVRHETAILMIVRGQRPEKPHDVESRGLTPEIWKFNQKCWHQSPTKRPNIQSVLNAWEGFDSTERLRSTASDAHVNYREKHYLPPSKPKRGRFCGLF